MKQLFVCLTLIPMLVSLSAQDIVLDKKVDGQYQDKRGPNMRQYGHGYVGLGLVIPYQNNSGSMIDPGRSPEFTIGYRYKLKLLSFYAIGFDLSGNWIKYGIRAEHSVPADITSNPLSQARDADKLSMTISSLDAEVYNRINIGKRGNILGNYLDIGLKGEWNYMQKLVIRESPAGDDYYSKSRIVQKNLSFIERFSTLVSARIGINKYIIYGNYRISELITAGYSTPELPPVTAGFQLAF